MTVLTALYAALLGLVAVGFALLAGASGVAGDAWLIGRGLFFSAISGLAAVALASRLAGRPAWSWRLVIGLVPAVAQLVWLAVR
jgi:hypothetical protein